jgi:hypothetical protein
MVKKHSCPLTKAKSMPEQNRFHCAQISAQVHDSTNARRFATFKEAKEHYDNVCKDAVWGPELQQSLNSVAQCMRDFMDAGRV